MPFCQQLWCTNFKTFTISVNWTIAHKMVCCRQQRPVAACGSVQSDQGFCCPHRESCPYLLCSNRVTICSRFAHLINRGYYMAIFISYPMSTQDPISARGLKARGLIWVKGWYGVWYENCHIIIYLSYMFSFWQVCLFGIVCGVKGKTAECSECDDMGFLHRQKSRITHMTWWYGFFALAKKPYHPRDPLSHLLLSTRVICAWKPC